MFFTYLAKVTAILLFALGVIKIGAGFYFAGSEYSALAAQRYLAAPTTGEAIDKGFVMLGVALILGVLAELSLQLKARSQAR